MCSCQVVNLSAETLVCLQLTYVAAVSCLKGPSCQWNTCIVLCYLGPTVLTCLRQGLYLLSYLLLTLFNPTILQYTSRPTTLYHVKHQLRSRILTNSISVFIHSLIQVIAAMPSSLNLWDGAFHSNYIKSVNVSAENGNGNGKWYWKVNLICACNSPQTCWYIIALYFDVVCFTGGFERILRPFSYSQRIS